MTKVLNAIVNHDLILAERVFEESMNMTTYVMCSGKVFSQPSFFFLNFTFFGFFEFLVFCVGC